MTCIIQECSGQCQCIIKYRAALNCKLQIDMNLYISYFTNVITLKIEKDVKF